MKPLRIVLVMPDPPLPFGQAMGRWFYVLLRGLVERGHSVTALVSCNPGPDAEKVRELFPPPRFDVRCFERPAHSRPQGEVGDTPTALLVPLLRRDEGRPGGRTRQGI